MTKNFGAGKVLVVVNQRTMNIKLKAKALRLKSILNKINDCSYAFDQINRQMPLSRANTEKDIQELIHTYEQLIVDLVNFLRTTEYGKKRN